MPARALPRAPQYTMFFGLASEMAAPTASAFVPEPAGALGVALGGAAVYHGELHERPQLGEGPPADADAMVLSSLVLALESDAPMTISDLYTLDYDHFKLSLEIIEEWRLDRYYSSKIRLLDASMEVGRLSTRTPDAVKPTMAQTQ